MKEVCEAERNWRRKSSQLIGQQQENKANFDQVIIGAIYFTFQDGKKSSLDRPNHTSNQVVHFKISVKTKRRKQIRFDKQMFFFITSIQLVACALRENLSNRSSGVEIRRDICTCFGRHFVKVKLDNNNMIFADCDG